MHLFELLINAPAAKPTRDIHPPDLPGPGAVGPPIPGHPGASAPLGGNGPKSGNMAKLAKCVNVPNRHPPENKVPITGGMKMFELNGFIALAICGDVCISMN